MDKLQAECDELRRRLTEQNDMQAELENLKRELEQTLEAHKCLQEVALALEEENRTVHEKYKIQLRDRAKLDEIKLDLETELESKTMNHDNLEKRFAKMKEKIASCENLEDLVYSLEKDKRRNTERISELEEELSISKTGNGAKSKDNDHLINKLTKENKELTVKLETYMEEMEELDAKNEQLENANKEFQKNLERVKSIELIGSNLTELAALETEKEDVEQKLKKEISKRETVENELFKLEEEYENYKIAQEESDEKLEAEIQKINQDLHGRKVPLEVINEQSTATDLQPTSGIEMGMRFLLKKKHKQLTILEKENETLRQQIKSLEQDHHTLLDENGTLAKDITQMDEQLHEIKSRYDNKVMQLQDRLESVEEKRQQMEQENLDRLMSSAEKELEYNKKCQENNRDVDRLNETLNSVTEELNVVREFLRVAADKNNELQVERDEAKRELYQKLNETPSSYQIKPLERQLPGHQEANNNSVETSSTTSSITSQESDKNYILQRMAMKYDEEKEEYETRLYEKSNVIKSLEDRIIAMRNFYERKLSSQHGNISSPEATPPVAIKNGRLHDSMDELSVTRTKSMDFSDDELETGDMVSDRELRRISYRIAEGSWKHLPNELNLRRKEEANQILNSTINDQQKIYRLLVCWRNEVELPRDEFLKQLIERVGSKRKDVVKFLKEMAGIQTKDGTIKTRFQKFKKSVKRGEVKY